MIGLAIILLAVGGAAVLWSFMTTFEGLLASVFSIERNYPAALAVAEKIVPGDGTAPDHEVSEALAAAGVDLVLNARGAEALEETAEAIETAADDTGSPLLLSAERAADTVVDLSAMPVNDDADVESPFGSLDDSDDWSIAADMSGDHEVADSEFLGFDEFIDGEPTAGMDELVAAAGRVAGVGVLVRPIAGAGQRAGKPCPTRQP